MNSTLRNNLQGQPLYILLLPLFFVWHGYVQFYDLITLQQAFRLLFFYLLGTILVFSFCWLVYKKKNKAGLFAFVIMCVYFFFGSFQDFLNRKFEGSFLTKYSFLLSAILFILVLSFILIKKRRSGFLRTTSFLNILLFILLLADTLILVNKLVKNRGIVTAGKNSKLLPCKDCPNPDIYLIVADGYSGRIPLQKLFNYDNSSFENNLRAKGFYITDSSFANYDYTVFSVGSLLNMDYLNTSAYFKGNRDLPIGFKAIRDSRVQHFLEKQGYDIYNYSIFDMEGHPSPAIKTLLNFEKSPLTTQTLLYRLNKDLGYHLLLRFKFLQRKRKNSLYFDRDNNIEIDSLTRKIVTTKSNRPKFVYTHLMMPHLPYYFDSAGVMANAEQLTDAAYHANKAAYIGYLKYSNNKYINLVDHIIQHNNRPAIIILVGDHGCRECLEKENQSEFQTMNLSAVLLPGRNYTGFYKGMTNVNLFRVLLNSQYNQHLDKLADSFILIHPDKKFLR